MIIIFCPATGGTADGEIYMYELDGGPARVLRRMQYIITLRRKRPRHYYVEAIIVI